MTTDVPGDILDVVDAQWVPRITKEPKITANELRIDENEVPDATGPPASGEALCTFTRSTEDDPLVEAILRLRGGREGS